MIILDDIDTYNLMKRGGLAMRFRVLQITALGLIISSSAAHSFTREEILKNPNAVAKYLASYADKGYACKSKNYEEAYINVIKFSTELKQFPYLSMANSANPKLESVTASKGINTLIVAHELIASQGVV
jgi:hypothetical protein